MNLDLGPRCFSALAPRFRHKFSPPYHGACERLWRQISPSMQEAWQVVGAALLDRAFR